MNPEKALSEYNDEELILIGEKHSSEDSYYLERELSLNSNPEFILYESFQGSDEELHGRLMKDEGPYISLINLLHNYQEKFPDEDQLLHLSLESLYDQAKTGEAVSTEPYFRLPESDMKLVEAALVGTDPEDLSEDRKDFLEHAIQMIRGVHERKEYPLEVQKGFMLMDSAYKNTAQGYSTQIRQLDKEREIPNEELKKLDEMNMDLENNSLNDMLEKMNELIEATDKTTEIATDEERNPEMERRIRKSLSDRHEGRPVMAAAGTSHIIDICDNFEVDTYSVIETPNGFQQRS